MARKCARLPAQMNAQSTHLFRSRCATATASIIVVVAPFKQSESSGVLVDFFIVIVPLEKGESHRFILFVVADVRWLALALLLRVRLPLLCGAHWVGHKVIIIIVAIVNS